MSLQSPPRFPGVEDTGPVPAEPQPPPQDRRGWVVMAAVVGAVVVAVVLVVARSTDGTDGPSPTTTAATTPTTASAPTTAPPATAAPTTAVPTVEDAVRAQYFAFWRAFDSYGRGTGPFDPVEFKATFGPVASGGEYTHLFDYFQNLRLRGLAFRGGGTPEEELSPKITMESPAEATIIDCASSTGETYNVKTGETVEPADPSHEQLIVVMRLADGVWRVTSVGGQGEPCA